MDFQDLWSRLSAIEEHPNRESLELGEFGTKIKRLWKVTDAFQHSSLDKCEALLDNMADRILDLAERGSLPSARYFAVVHYKSLHARLLKNGYSKN